MNSKKYALKLIIRTDRLNSKGQSPIYARIITDKKLEISTSMYVSKVDWDPHTQRLKMDATDAGTTNAFLDSFCSKVLDLFTKMFMNGEVINGEILRERLFGKIEKVISLISIFGSSTTYSQALIRAATSTTSWIGELMPTNLSRVLGSD